MNVINQRYEVYDFKDEKIKELIPKKGEIVCIDGTDFVKQVISLIGNGIDKIAVLYVAQRLKDCPHLWPEDGTEVDLKDGTFGRRRVIFQDFEMASTIINENIQVATAQANMPAPNVISFSGRLLYNIVGSLPSIILATLAPSSAAPPALRIIQSSQGSISIQIMLVQFGAIPNNIKVDLDCWVRYTK